MLKIFLQQSKEIKIEELTIEYTNKKIDELVYKLYGLTEEEIRIVEGN